MQWWQFRRWSDSPLAHCADRDRSTKSRCDRFGRPIPPHQAGRDRRSAANCTAARLGARSANLGQSANLAHRSRRSARTIAIADLPGTASWWRSARPERKPVSATGGVQAGYKWRRWDHLKEERRRTEIETQRRASVADLYEW